MNSLKHALLEAKVISTKDVRRVERQQKKEELIASKEYKEASSDLSLLDKSLLKMWMEEDLDDS